MTKVSSFPLTIWHWFASHAISPVRHSLIIDLGITLIHQLNKLSNQWRQSIQRQGLWIWLFALAGASLLMVWHGALLLALSIGLATTFLLQHLPPRPVPWQAVSQWISRTQTPSLISVGCGLLSLIASYMTLLIWQDTHSFWLALAILLQGLGVLSILGFCLWQMLKPNQQQLLPAPAPAIDYWIHDLTALEPLKRLMAIRQINRFVISTSTDSSRTQELKEYFQLLLDQESDATIQKAIVEGLRIINSSMDTPQSPQSKFAKPE